MRGLLEEGAAVVDIRGDAGILKRAIRILLHADVMDARVDFHRVDVLDALLECDGDIDAGPGANDEYALRDGARSLIDEAVKRQGVEPAVRGFHRLVWNPVHQKRHGSRRLGDQPNLVVGGPAVRGDKRLEAEQDDDDRQGWELPSEVVPVGKQKQDDDDHGSPGKGWSSEERQRREGDDAGETAENVEPVGVEWGKLSEGSGDPLADQRHDPGYPQEEDRKGQPGWQPGLGAQCPEEDEFGARSIDLDREDPHERDQRRKANGSEAKQVATGIGSQESKPDSEKTRQQDEVREVGKVKDVGAGPPNQGQLNKEH